MKISLFFQRPIHVVGIALLVLSFLGYILFPQLEPRVQRGMAPVLFFAQYIVAVLFALVSLFIKRDLYVKAIGLTLMYISCFILNTNDMALLGEFSLYLSVMMVLTQVVQLSLHILPKLSIWGQRILLFLAGYGLLFSIHLAIYLMPSYALGAIGIIFFGIGILVFVPLLSSIHFIRLLHRHKLEFSVHRRWFWSGFLAPVLVTLIYVWFYAGFQSRIERATQEYHTSQKFLPKALFIKQRMDFTAIEEHFLRIDKSHNRRSDLFVSVNGHHQPTIDIAHLLIGAIPLSEPEKDALMHSIYEYRHENNPRYWSGRDLVTSRISTEIDVYSKHRIAYVEKIIEVELPEAPDWRTTQEAIYTFHIPQGAVGTSLSLWMNGREEPARLSTTGVADSAYSTIVGVESRDPALMKWKEGNKLVVNVFPVRPDLPRKFKIGYTIPISYHDGSLNLRNTYFQGPDYSKGHETLQINFVDATPDAPIVSDRLEKIEHGYQAEFKVQTPWSLQWNAPALSKDKFCFNGNCYEQSQYRQAFKAFKPKGIVLDLNELWTEKDLELIMAKISGIPFYVYENPNELIELGPGNLSKVLNYQGKWRFSIFPPALFENSQVKSSDYLVITKGHHQFPSMGDFDFGNQIWDKQNSLLEHPFFFFELGRTLHMNGVILEESGLAEAHFGSIDDLLGYLEEEKFPVNNVNSKHVGIPTNQMSIRKSSTKIEGDKAPDHLMRLFNYGLLMHQLRNFYFKRGAVKEEHIDLAKSAYVVSPFSSLVSLESINDYQRFEIHEPNKSNSLKNAGIFSSGSGSVPEPHEWALLALAAIALGLLLIKRWF